MKQSQSNHTQQWLEQMIEAYFDCRLTEQQEHELRQALATTELSGQSIDEARATMGFMSVGMEAERRRQATATRAKRRRWVAVAASVAVVAVVGVGLIVHNRAQTADAGSCVAWVGGHEVTADNQVMRLVQADLHSMGTASPEVGQNISEQLGELGAAIERD